MFTLGLIIFIVSLLLNQVDDSNMFEDYPDADYVLQQGRTTVSNADGLFLFIIVGLSLFVIISSAIIYNHPAFFVIGFFMLTIILLISAVISNTFWDFSNSTTIISEVAATYPKITFIMNNLPIYILFMGISSLIAGIIGRNYN